VASKFRTFYIDKNQQGILTEATTALVQEIGLEGGFLTSLEAVNFGGGILQLNVVYQTQYPRTLLAMHPPPGSIIEAGIDVEHAALLFSDDIDPGSYGTGSFAFDGTGLDTTEFHTSADNVVNVRLPATRTVSSLHTVDVDASKLVYASSESLQHSDILGFNLHTQTSAHLGQAIPYTAKLGKLGEVEVQGIRIDKTNIPSERITQYLEELGVSSERLIAISAADIEPSLVYVVFAYYRTLEPYLVQTFPYNNSVFLYASQDGDLTLTFIFLEELDAAYVAGTDGLFRLYTDFDTYVEITSDKVTVESDLKTVRVNVESRVTATDVYDFRITGLISADGTVQTRQIIYSIQILGYAAGGGGAPTDAKYVVTEGHGSLSAEVLIAAPLIGDGSVTDAEFQRLDGVTSDIQPQFGAITANDWVTTARIADNAITNALMANDAVDSAEIAAGAVDLVHMSANSIDSPQYVDGSIDLAHMSADSVDSPQYVNASIDTAHIGNLQITTALIAADAITAAKIADDAIDSDMYVDGSIDTAHIAADQITSALIADNQIDSEHIAAGSLDTEHYAAGSVDATALGADCVTAAKIGDNVINSEHYAAASIDNEHLADNAVDSDELAADAVTTAHLGDDQVTYAKIQNVSATDKILGRDSAGEGVIEEISPASLLTMLGVEPGATADQSASEIKTLLEDGIDSVHYVDGSIDNVHLANIGIANNDLVEIDHASVADNDYAKFTAGGLEGRSYAEVKGDLGLSSSFSGLEDANPGSAPLNGAMLSWDTTPGEWISNVFRIDPNMAAGVGGEVLTYSLGNGWWEAAGEEFGSAGVDAVTDLPSNTQHDEEVFLTGEYNISVVQHFSKTGAISISGHAHMTGETLHLTGLRTALTVDGSGLFLEDVQMSGTLTVTGLATLTTPTLVTPTIASFANASHDHSNSAGGGAIDHADLSTIGAKTHATLETDITNLTTTGTNHASYISDLSGLMVGTTGLLTGHTGVTAHGVGFIAGTGETQDLHNKTLYHGVLGGALNANAQELTGVSRLGVGTTGETNSLVYIQGTAFATAPGANTDDKLTIEHNGNVKINLIGNAAQALVFSDATRDRANITYDHSTDAMTIKSAGTTSVGITAGKMIIQNGVAETPDADHVLTVKGNIVAYGGASTSASTRNGQCNVWVDQGFGHELHYHAIHGFAHGLYGRTADVHSMRFMAYAANETSQGNATSLGCVKPNGDWGFGTLTPTEVVHTTGKVRANDTFNHNGTDGITKAQFSFADSFGSTHTVTINGGLITQWDILGE